MLTELLDKQQALKDNLVQRSRLAFEAHSPSYSVALVSCLTGTAIIVCNDESVLAFHSAALLAVVCRAAPKCLLKRLLTREVALLATRQQTLVEIFQKQMDLVKAYVTVKKLSTQPGRRPRSTVGRRQPDHSYSKAHVCDQNSQKRMDQKADGVLRPAADIFTEHKEAPAAAAAAAASVTPRKNSVTRTDVQTEEASDLQGSSLKSGNTSTCISFRMKAGDALIQASAEDSSRRLSELIDRGLVSPGDVLQLQLKVR